MSINEDLQDEISALAAIYDAECLSPSSIDPCVFILTPPESVVSPALSLRLEIPSDYPSSKPRVLDGGTGADLAREVLETAWREGEVCLYDLIEGLRELLELPDENPSPPRSELSPPPPESVPELQRQRQPQPEVPIRPWCLSCPQTEKKSVFLGHALTVRSPAEARQAISDLIAGDKKLQRATHNIWAYRIVREDTGTVMQDNDDDGETAAGSRLAHLLQVMDVRNVVVVVARWYGGIKLGPHRFALINMVAREALVGGGWAEKKEGSVKKKGKK